MEIMEQIGNGRLAMDDRICVGFGSAFATKDNDIFYYADSDREYEECLSIGELEVIAAKDPSADWRVHLIGPLSETHYQRQGSEQWVLYEKGMGFA